MLVFIKERHEMLVFIMLVFIKEMLVFIMLVFIKEGMKCLSL
jgi:hypothetical protein